MRIAQLRPLGSHSLHVVADDGREGVFDVGPYLTDEAFAPLADPCEFAKVASRGYFIEWECGADLSADTIEARWQPVPAVRAANNEAAAVEG